MCIRDRGSRGRVLLRKSGTEPLIRVMVEGEDEAQVTEFAHRIEMCIRDSPILKMLMYCKERKKAAMRSFINEQSVAFCSPACGKPLVLHSECV